ncbi:substrate-binding domain-containing protein [uncultured Sunxiuqinia sp.]|uniref:LacI family DNA-binding transcriptional regulator n=1 Tax=uncultured Sunxiuqinia sp. TaxID=1573825 RepID=UPI002635CC0A|nr:substrate-binding domain-containing protein [uncultured Sunxiuqinia sp.]
MAEKANVSIGTVDRVIHKRGEVSPATRDKIMKIIEELDYHPNILASTLASKKVYSLGVIIPEPQTEEAYWNKPLIGISRAFNEIQQYGIEIEIHQFKQNDVADFKAKAERLLEKPYDGVMLAPFFSRESKAFIQKLEERNIPFVFIDSNIKDSSKLSYIGQNSFQSGTLAAKLLDFSVPNDATILLVHVAKEMDNQNHLMQREMGFYNYFKEKKSPADRKILTVEINDAADDHCYLKLENEIQKAGNVKGIFVTNSRVYKIAEFVEAHPIPDLRLVGHDLIPNNSEFVRKGVVDFLICQRPEEQGYQAIVTLFQHLILKKTVPSENYTSIDIITKENLDFYQEFNTNNYGTN